MQIELNKIRELQFSMNFSDLCLSFSPANQSLAQAQGYFCLHTHNTATGPQKYSGEQMEFEENTTNPVFQ